MALLERDSFLQQLSNFLDDVAVGRGKVVFLGGEAGVGKTTVVRAFTASLPQGVRFAVGVCDPLSMPRPLGPLLDVAPSLGLDSTLEESSRFPLFHAVLESFKLNPTVVVFEDVHWADEATLDLLRFLGRRIEATRTLLVVTYRDDEVGPQHPLRLVLGELATSSSERMGLPRLTLEAVRHLVQDSEYDADELHRQTGGNPFFVTEILASHAPGLPATVRDAVLARAARLSQPGRAVLEVAAVIGSRVAPWLLAKVVSAELTALDECLAVGMLQATEHEIAFRHDLARQAVLEVTPPHRQQVLHRLVLAALEASAVDDPARLAHHAEGALDAAAVQRYAPEAARRAAEFQAHREAFAQYARALRFATSLAPHEQAQLLEDYAREGAVVDALDEAITSLQSAINLRKQSGELLKVAADLSYLARLAVLAGRNAQGMVASRAALDVLQALAPSVQHARAYQIHAHLWMLDRNPEEARRWGHKALELSERLDDKEVTISALNTLGSALLVSGDASGRELLERSLTLAQEQGLHASVSAAFSNLASGTGEMYRFAEADHYLSEGIGYCLELDLDFDRFYMLSWQALSHLYQGRWREASETALLVTKRSHVATISRIMSLVALGRVRTRRGDPEAWPVLDEALELAVKTGTLQRLGPVHAARAEAAWLAGDAEQARQEAHAAFELALQKGHRWFVGELAYWRWKVGELSEVPVIAAEPFALQMAGEWQEAAAAWTELSCPYEAARALAEGDEAALKEALAMFKRLGAEPAARHLSQRMQTLGITGVPRGPRPSTRDNPAHLTRRELEVLKLLALGLSDSGIAAKLFRSHKTVSHHVSAILAKLEAQNRTEAVHEATRLGILDQNREFKDSK